MANSKEPQDYKKKEDEKVETRLAGDTVDIEDGLSLTLKVNVTDGRLQRRLANVTSLNEKLKGEHDNETASKINAEVFGLLTVLYGNSGLDELEEHFAEKNGTVELEDYLNSFKPAFEPIKK